MKESCVVVVSDAVVIVVIGEGIKIWVLICVFKEVDAPRGDTPLVALVSVKGSIAHADCAAGVTGLAKTLLMLWSRGFSPVANRKSPNPQVDLAHVPVFVNIYSTIRVSSTIEFVMIFCGTKIDME